MNEYTEDDAYSNPDGESADDAALRWMIRAKTEQRRALKAEQERDEAQAEREEMRESLHLMADSVKSRATKPRPLTPDAMTAREHLDAAWEAAHVMTGPVEDGTKAIRRWDGQVTTCTLHSHAAMGSPEYRLLDPAAPARPEGAEGIEALIDRAGTEGEGADSEALADYLARRGVRVVAEGEN